MSEVTIIGIDLAKRVFQLHGARHDGSVVFRKELFLTTASLTSKRTLSGKVIVPWVSISPPRRQNQCVENTLP